MAMSRKEVKQIAKVQDLVGQASGWHGNDRDSDGFSKGQEALREAFRICVNVLGKYPPVEAKAESGEAHRP